MLNNLKRKDQDLILKQNDAFRRCDCGELIRVSNIPMAHAGHIMRTAWSFSVLEWIKIKIGLL